MSSQMLFRPSILVVQARVVTVLWRETNDSRNGLEREPGTGLEHSVGLDVG